MNQLPKHGRVACDRCFKGCNTIKFNETQRVSDQWRLTANPLAWGNNQPEIIVLGFSKGPNQISQINKIADNDIAFKGHRANIGKILSHIGIFKSASADDISASIRDTNGRIHWGSLIRCTVEYFNQDKKYWTGTGNGILQKFLKSNFGNEISTNCAKQYLSQLPSRTKLVVMFGMGANLTYVKQCFDIYKNSIDGDWKWINDVSYSNGRVTIVHVEHFASQGALIPCWLGEKESTRSLLGELAREAVFQSKILMK